MCIGRIDHFVLTVRSIKTPCEFYSRVVGMQAEESTKRYSENPFKKTCIACTVMV